MIHRFKEIVMFAAVGLAFLVADSADAGKLVVKTPGPKNKVAAVKRNYTAKAVSRKRPVIKRPARKRAQQVRKSKRRGSGAELSNAAVTVRNGRTRIDFEDLLIQGQLKRANTVYLFERGENQLDSLVKKKEDFRQEIYENYLD